MKEKKVIKNAAWIIFSRVLQAIVNLVITILTTRYLGPSDFGTLNYAASIVAFAVPVMQLGLTSVAVQELVNHPDEEGKIIGSSISICILSSILSMLGIFAFVSIANHNETVTIIVCMLYSLMIFSQAFDIIQYWYQAKLLSKYTSIVSLIIYIIVTAYKVFLLVVNKGVEWFAVSYALDFILINSILIIIYKKLGGQKFKFSKDVLKRMLKRSKYYILSGIMISVFANTDRIMLKLMIDEASTGYYAAAATCAGMTSFVFVAIIDSFRPVIFECKKDDNNLAYENNMCRLYSIILYMAIFQSIIITIFAKYIILLLYGESFSSSTSVLQLIVWYTTFSYIGSVRNIWLLAENQQNLIWKIDLSGAISNIVLNALLIPFMGIMGAALASLLTQFFANFVMVWIFKKSRPNIKLMIKSLSPKYIIEMFKMVTKKQKN